MKIVEKSLTYAAFIFFGILIGPVISGMLLLWASLAGDLLFGHGFDFMDVAEQTYHIAAWIGLVMGIIVAFRVTSKK